MYRPRSPRSAWVTGEFIGRLAGWPPSVSKWVGVAAVALLVAINMTGVASGRWVQNVATSAKVLALSAVVVMAFAAGHGEGWHGTLAGAPTGLALFGALAIAFQSVIWSYYGYGDAAKIAEEVVDPGRTLPRVFLFGIAIATGLYLLLNAAFLHVPALQSARHIGAGRRRRRLNDLRGARQSGDHRAGAARRAGVAQRQQSSSRRGLIFGLAREGLGHACSPR